MPVPQNADQALTLIKSMETFYGNAFRGFKDNESIYDGYFERLVALPEGFEPTIPTTGRAIVDEAVDNCMPADVQIHYAPRGAGKQPELDADLIRRWCRALFRHWRRNSSDIDFLRDGAKNLFISGFAAWKIVPDWTLWPTLPDGTIKQLREAGGTKLSDRVTMIKSLRDRNTALVVRSLPPRCVLVDPTVGARKLWIAERYVANANEIRDLYAQWESDFSKYDQTAGLHKVHELWTATYVDYQGNIHDGKQYVFIDEKLVNESENPYGEIPYVIAFSGFGRESYEGKPELKAAGFYTPQVKSLLYAQARRLSQFDAIMAQVAFPIGVMPTSVDPDSFDTSPGAMNFVPDIVFQNTDKIWLQAKIPAAEYANSMHMIDSQIERGTTQSALRGAPTPDTKSAAQLGMVTQQALLRVETVKEILEDVVAILLSRAVFFTEMILKDKVSIWVGEKDTERYALGPQNIKGHYDVGVSFMVNEEQRKGQKLALANDAIVKGGMDPYTALEYAGFENPSEIIARRLAYDVMQEPLIKRALGKEMLKSWGIDADQEELEEQIEQGKLQKMLQEAMEALQTGSLRGVGDPMTANGSPPGGGGQEPNAALAQTGQGPMAMNTGAPVQAPQMMPPAQMQQTGQAA